MAATSAGRRILGGLGTLLLSMASAQVSSCSASTTLATHSRSAGHDLSGSVAVTHRDPSGSASIRSIASSVGTSSYATW